MFYIVIYILKYKELYNNCYTESYNSLLILYVNTLFGLNELCVLKGYEDFFFTGCLVRAKSGGLV